MASPINRPQKAGNPPNRFATYVKATTHDASPGTRRRLPASSPNCAFIGISFENHKRHLNLYAPRNDGSFNKTLLAGDLKDPTGLNWTYFDTPGDLLTSGCGGTVCHFRFYEDRSIYVNGVYKGVESNNFFMWYDFATKKMKPAKAHASMKERQNDLWRPVCLPDGTRCVLPIGTRRGPLPDFPMWTRWTGAWNLVPIQFSPEISPLEWDDDDREACMRSTRTQVSACPSSKLCITVRAADTDYDSRCATEGIMTMSYTVAGNTWRFINVTNRPEFTTKLANTTIYPSFDVLEMQCVSDKSCFIVGGYKLYNQTAPNRWEGHVRISSGASIWQWQAGTAPNDPGTVKQLFTIPNKVQSQWTYGARFDNIVCRTPTECLLALYDPDTNPRMYALRWR